jgi:hypothetical protein
MIRFSGITLIRVTTSPYETFNKRFDNLYERNQPGISPEERQVLIKEEEALQKERLQAVEAAFEKLNYKTRAFMAAEAEKNKENPHYYATGFTHINGYGDPQYERLVVDGDDLQPYLLDQHLTRQQFLSHLESKYQPLKEGSGGIIRTHTPVSHEDGQHTSLEGYREAPIPRFYNLDDIQTSVREFQDQRTLDFVRDFADLEVFRKYKAKATQVIDVTV